MTDKAPSGHAPSPYRNLIGQAAWRRWTAASASCRLPIAMAPLALVLVGRNATGSFATGAIMASAYTFAEALCAPAAGRLLGRAGDLRRGLGASLACAAVVLAGLSAAAAIKAPVGPLVALSILAGAIPSGVQGGLRAILERLVTEELRPVAFALDATLLEIEYLAGPALVGVASLAGAPTAAAIMAAATVGAVAMVRTLPAQQRSPHHAPPTSSTVEGSAWLVPAALSSYATSLLLGYGEGTVTLTIAPLLSSTGGSAADSGFILVGLSAASAIGGFGYSWLAPRLPPPSSHRIDLLLALAGLLLVPISLAPSVRLIALAVAGFGVLIAPINALRTYQLGQALPEHQHAEGFSILYGAMGVGVGVSGLASAAILHAAGPHAPFAVASVIVVTFTGILALHCHLHA